jgi:hypothetical protein
MCAIHKKLRITSIVVLAVLTVASSSLGISAETGGDASQENAVNSGARVEATGVVLYYFHGTRRCNTCRSIEAYAQEAVEGKFKDALQAGALEWTVLNTDEPEYAHFVKDFGLVSSSLVVVELDGGEVVRHEILQDAWTLVRDKPRFIAYVQKSVGEYLE